MEKIMTFKQWLPQVILGAIVGLGLKTCAHIPYMYGNVKLVIVLHFLLGILLVLGRFRFEKYAPFFIANIFGIAITEICLFIDIKTSSKGPFIAILLTQLIALFFALQKRPHYWLCGATNLLSAAIIYTYMFIYYPQQMFAKGINQESIAVEGAIWKTAKVLRPSILPSGDERRLIYFYDSKCRTCYKCVMQLKKIIPPQRLVLLNDGLYDDSLRTTQTPEHDETNLPSYWDKESKIYKHYKINGTPTWLIINKEGKVVSIQDGRSMQAGETWLELQKEYLNKFWGDDWR